MIRLQYSGVIALVLCVPVLTGCDVKGGLSAYLHKSDAAPEPPAIAAASASNGTAAAPVPAQPSPTYAASGAAPPPAVAVRAKTQEPPASAARVLPSASAAQEVAHVPAPPSTSVPTLSSAPLATAAPAAPPPVPQVKTTGQRNVSIGGAAISGGNVSNAARVVAGFRKPLRDCYSLDTTGTEGSIRFTIKVGPTGAVSGVNAQPGGPFSSQLMACATSVIRAAKFDAPEGGAAQVVVPTVFVIQ